MHLLAGSLHGYWALLSCRGECGLQPHPATVLDASSRILSPNLFTDSFQCSQLPAILSSPRARHRLDGGAMVVRMRPRLLARRWASQWQCVLMNCIGDRQGCSACLLRSSLGPQIGCCGMHLMLHDFVCQLAGNDSSIIRNQNMWHCILENLFCSGRWQRSILGSQKRLSSTASSQLR